MNGNEIIIIFLAIILLPIFLWALIKMPNSSHCGSCGTPLNIHRQKSYHSVIGNKNIEVCKNCHKANNRFTPTKIKPQLTSPNRTLDERVSINEVFKETKPSTRSTPQQIQTHKTVVAEKDSVSKVLTETKPNNRIIPQQIQTHRTVEAEKDSVSKVLTETKPNNRIIPQQTQPNSVVTVKNYMSEVLPETKPLTSSDNPQQPPLLSVIGENISISEVLEDIRANNCFWLDTETTGITDCDEIIELSVCTHDKQVVFNSILKSTVKCSAKARAIHGITDDQIANGMPFESAKAILVKLLAGKTIISFNADFDCKMLFQTLGLKTKKRFCVMKWSQSVLDYDRWPRLELVCERLNIKQREAHRALADTYTTIDVFNKLVDLTKNHKSILRDFASIDLSALEQLEDEETLFLFPNSNIFSFDCLIDRYGNTIIGIRSKALKRMLKTSATRIFVKNSRNGKTLKIQYITQPDMQLPISIHELSNRLNQLKLKAVNPNKYLSMDAVIDLSNINKKNMGPISGMYYFPSIAINEKIYENMDNLPIFHNRDRESVAFTIKTPKNTLKKLFALGLQGYSSILEAVEHDEKIIVTAYHLLDKQNITILNSWSLDGEKAWSGDY